MSLTEAFSGIDIPTSIRETLVVINVSYISFDTRLHLGQLVVHRSVVVEVQDIFVELLELSFPIQHAIPVVRYGWNDDASMRANNSSAFNYRTIAGTEELSVHALGLAVDINPAFNPYTRRDGVVIPHGAIYDTTRPGTITNDIARVFTRRGWEWGGDWKGTRKDWQHFSK